MATKVDIAGTNITAPQMKEFHDMASRPGSHVNRATFQLYLERRNPFAFERNEHGHVVVTFVGLELTGAEEVARLSAAKYDVRPYAKSCLLSTRDDSYDRHHRLVAGQTYRVALVPGAEIKADRERTTDALRKLGIERYGYEKPFGGIVPRIRENVSDKDMEELGIYYIAALHDPILGSDGVPNVLCSDRDVSGRRLGAGWGGPGRQWSGSGAFAFLLPAK